jgi:hypothetical protein
MTQPWLTIRLYLLPADQGGRRTPISSGYRVGWDIGNTTDAGEPELNDATVRFVDPDQLAPGADTEAELLPHVPERWQGVSPGDELVAREGRRLVAKAHVLPRAEGA